MEVARRLLFGFAHDRKKHICGEPIKNGLGGHRAVPKSSRYRLKIYDIIKSTSEICRRRQATINSKPAIKHY